MLAGGGIPQGLVVGATGPDGMEVTDRPIKVPDLFRTLSNVLGVDADEERTTPLGRPITTVDGGKAIQEIVG